MSTDISDITGEHNLTDKRTLIYPFDRYEIEVELSAEGKFIGISGVKINRNFLTHLQRLSSFEVLDVDKYYQEADKE